METAGSVMSLSGEGVAMELKRAQLDKILRRPHKTRPFNPDAVLVARFHALQKAIGEEPADTFFQVIYKPDGEARGRDSAPSEIHWGTKNGATSRLRSKDICVTDIAQKGTASNGAECTYFVTVVQDKNHVAFVHGKACLYVEREQLVQPHPDVAFGKPRRHVLMRKNAVHPDDQ